MIIDIDKREDSLLTDLSITLWLNKLDTDTWRWKRNKDGRLAAVEFDNSEDAVAFRLLFKL